MQKHIMATLFLVYSKNSKGLVAKEMVWARETKVEDKLES